MRNPTVGPYEARPHHPPLARASAWSCAYRIWVLCSVRQIGDLLELIQQTVMVLRQISHDARIGDWSALRKLVQF